jgi:CubicO group peptidase (beta-lactamase class C family)
MRNYIKPFVTGILFCAIIPAAYSQPLPTVITDKIDSLFSQSGNTSPGYAVGIIRNDSLLYAKGYGLANLEYNIPITSETIFHMASISKQFTAYSIVLLARQGKLNLDDDIHKYLTWFPDLKEKITIRNLLNHTSGVRDQWQLLAISGTRLDDVITQDQIVKILTRQQALNFKPGDKYYYSNSGFTLLAEIVKSVTGKTLRQFTDSVLFKPLGMNNTHFHDDYTEIVPNRSYSYSREGPNHYANAVLSYSNAGATSLFTNIDDMSKWVMNFYGHTVGDQKDVDQLTQKGRLNSGKVLDYALGIAVDSFSGQKRYQHGGADAGYRTFISVFPDLKMGFVVFSNLDDANPQRKADQIAALFIKDPAPKKEVKPDKDSALALLTDTPTLKGFVGDYISDDGAHFAFRILDKKLFWITPNGTHILMIRAGKDTFKVFSSPDVNIVFSVAGGKQPVADEYWPPDNHRHLEKYDTSAKADNVLLSYTGTYYCPELDCNYRIILKDHHLVLTNAKYNDTPLRLYGDNRLGDDFWWMSNIKILRDNRNTITGFEVNSGRVEHLWFKKLP